MSARFPQDLTARLPRRAAVRDRFRLTSTGTILVDFEVLDPDPFDFVPGQFVAIDMEDPVLGYRRSPYCLYGASERNRTFTLLIRRVPEGPVSLFLTDLVVGDIVSFRGPTGHSMVPTRDHDLVLVATGVGIGPCLLLLRHLASHDRTRSVRLHWGLRQEEDICLTSELDLLTADLPNFEWDISLSQPSHAWTGTVGRVTETVPPTLETLGDKRFYLVSNGGMVAELGTALREMGVANRDIHEESYFDHRHRPDPETVRQIVGRFVATDVTSPFGDLEETLRRRR